MIQMGGPKGFGPEPPTKLGAAIKRAQQLANKIKKTGPSMGPVPGLPDSTE
jgi:hypothetical protein